MEIVMQTIGEKVIEVGLYRTLITSLLFGVIAIVTLASDNKDFFSKLLVISATALSFISAFFSIVGIMALNS